MIEVIITIIITLKIQIYYLTNTFTTVDKTAAQRERNKLRERERRANLSEDQRAIIKAKNNERQRKKWAEIKASDKNKYEERLEKQRAYHQNTIEERLEKQKEYYLETIEKRQAKQKEYYQDTIEERQAKQKEYRSHNSDTIAENRRIKLQEMKASDPERYENHLARRREYQRNRYAKMKDAEKRLQNASELLDEEDINVEELQNLANKRRKLIDAANENKRNNKCVKWVQIQQFWDEDHPCQ